MAVKRKNISVKSKRVGETYQALHACRRARAIHEFRYGTRSETDQTMIWTVTDSLGPIEYAATDHAGVRAHVANALFAHDIRSATILDETWCGYPVLEIVRESDGSVSYDRFRRFPTIDDYKPMFGPPEPAVLAPVLDLSARLLTVGVMA